MNYDGIPSELKAMPNWTVWKWVKEKGKRRKVPYQIDGVKKARSNDPSTWTSFDLAYSAFTEAEGAFDGICWMMPLKPGKHIFIDIDRCIKDGIMEAWAQEVVKGFNSYTEISQSGNGIHIIIEANKPFKRCRKHGSPFEIYDSLRPCYLTGDTVDDLTEIQPRQEELNKFMVKIFGEQKAVNENDVQTQESRLSVEKVMRRITSSAKAEEIDALFKGDISAYENDDSAADLALCNHLAFFSEKDPSIIDQLFRSSGLMRPKWDEMHGSKTYGQMTIEKAIAGTKEVYKPRISRSTPENALAVYDMGNLTIENLTIVNRTNEGTGEETRMFSPSLAARSILQEIPLKFAANDVTDRGKEPEIWVCRRDGIWSPDGDHLIIGLCDKVAGDLSTKYALSETLRRIKNALRMSPVEFDTGNPHLVGTSNGYACNLITGEVRKIEPDDYISTDLILPVEYDPNAKCPEIFKFYDSVCSDDCSKMAMIDDDVATLDLVQWQYALLELGLGGNGKGVRQKFRKKFFGNYSIASIPLKDLNTDIFAMGEIFRKRAVNCGETSRDEGRGIKYNTTLVKRLTGDDEIAAPRKYKGRHSFTPFAKLTIDANVAPRFDDDSRGFTRRFRRINLPYFFTDNPDSSDPTHRPIDPQIYEKITTKQELSGYLNMLLERALEIVKDRRFPSCDHLTKGYEEQVYSIEEFIEQFCEVDMSDPKHWIAAADLYQNFEKWVTLANASPSNKKSFGRAFGNLTGIRSRIHRPDGTGKPVKAYVGIDFDWVRFADAISELEKKLVTNMLPNCNQEKDISNQCNQCNQLSERYMALREKFGGSNPVQIPLEEFSGKYGYIGYNGYSDPDDIDSGNGNGYIDGYNMVTDDGGACVPAPVDLEPSQEEFSEGEEMFEYLADGLYFVCDACAEEIKWVTPHISREHNAGLRGPS